MKRNMLMEGVRATMSPEMKARMELSVGIANRIYDVIEARGMTQKEFAELVGKTETEVSRWLSGTHNFTMATIAKITAALEEEIVAPVTKRPSRKRATDTVTVARRL